MKRREFLKLCVAAGFFAAMPDLVGCGAKMPKMKVGAGKALAIVNGRVVDVVKGRVFTNATIIIEGNRIKTVDFGPAPKPSGVLDILDAGGLYLIPGLMDAHCHSTSSGSFSIKSLEAWRHLFQIRRQAEACIGTGVTTIRDVGAFPGILHENIREIESGVLNGPRIVFCNAILNVAGGHPDIPPTDVNAFANVSSISIGMLMTNYANERERERALRENCTDANFVKLTVDRESLFRGKGEIPAYSDDDLKRIFGFAEDRSLPVVCHCLSKWGFDRMKAWPVHSLEHIVADELLTEREVELFARTGTAVVPTITLAETFLIEEAYSTLPREYNTDFVRDELVRRREYIHNVPAFQCDPKIHADNLASLNFYRQYSPKEMIEHKIYMAKPEPFFNMAIKGVANLLAMRQAGVPIGVGMDAGLPFAYFGSLHRELEMLHRIGFTLPEVLKAATIVNAKILGVDDRLGTLSDGKGADIVALVKNPLEDSTAYREVEMVWKDGRLVHSRHEPHRRDDGVLAAAKHGMAA